MENACAIPATGGTTAGLFFECRGFRFASRRNELCGDSWSGAGLGLPGVGTGGPSRPPAGTRGKDERSIAENAASRSGSRASPAQSATRFETSRIWPCRSTMPGRSCPGSPKRTSFMICARCSQPPRRHRSRRARPGPASPPAPWCVPDRGPRKSRHRSRSWPQSR